MALPALINGSACGPTNPLASLAKTLHQDRSLVQDSFSHAPLAGPSSQSFRSQASPSRHQIAPQHDEQRFLNGPGNRFDMSPMARALTPLGPKKAGLATPPPPAWAADFMNKDVAYRHTTPKPSDLVASERVAMEGAFGSQRLMHSHPIPGWDKEFSSKETSKHLAGRAPLSEQIHVNRVGMPMSVGRPGMGIIGFHPMVAPMGGQIYMQPSRLSPSLTQHPVSTQGSRELSQESWETAFGAHDIAASPTLSVASSRDAIPILPDLQGTDTTYVLRSHSPDRSSSPDALARTAGSLLETVESRHRAEAARKGQDTDDAAGEETRAKFQQSSFMDLMRKLRDGEVKVEGDKVVEQLRPEHRIGGPHVHDKGKGKAVDDSFSSQTGGVWSREYGQSIGNSSAATLSQASRSIFTLPQTSASSSVDVDSIMRSADAARLQEYEAAIQEANAMMEEDDRIRDAAHKGAFIGDGGAINGDMSDFMLAADRVDEDVMQPTRNDSRVLGARPRWEEEFDTEDDRWDPRNIVGAPLTAEDFRLEAEARARAIPTAQQQEWALLQDAVDEEITQAQLKASGYPFQTRNPFLHADRAWQQVTSTRQHERHMSGIHTPPAESVLEREAAVQRDPTSAMAWFDLGVKQQENEREDMAIKALRHALELDPQLGQARLALAISYTNEALRREALQELESWVKLRGITTLGPVDPQQLNPIFMTETGELHAKLMNTLIDLARAAAGASGQDVDADVQIALGVLFNASEEYAKAADCFASALGVRPDDPLLFNRLGATLANSGNATAAMEYYERALELQPAYIRARYNLAISCINLNLYREAAEHLLGALEMQRQESAQLEGLIGELGEGPEAVTGSASNGMSDAIWETLTMCSSLLQRPDLTECCQSRDLDAFQSNFTLQQQQA